MNNILDEIKNILIKNNLKLSIGESCTGGLISSYLTDIDGASNFIEINFVTYANEAKIKFLDVKKERIEKFGVVSPEIAHDMALGLLKYSDISISTTGYASSTNGDKNNSKGTVYFGFGYKSDIKVLKFVSSKKERVEVKKDMVEHILFKFLEFLKTALH